MHILYKSIRNFSANYTQNLLQLTASVQIYKPIINADLDSDHFVPAIWYTLRLFRMVQTSYGRHSHYTSLITCRQTVSALLLQLHTHTDTRHSHHHWSHIYHLFKNCYAPLVPTYGHNNNSWLRIPSTNTEIISFPDSWFYSSCQHNEHRI